MSQSNAIPVDNNNNVNVNLQAQTVNLATYQGADPAIAGVYLHAIVDTQGLAVANATYYVLFNPVGNTKIGIVEGVTIDCYTTGTVNPATSSMNVFKISSAPTGGTQIAQGSIQKFLTTFPNATLQVFVANPTVTTVGNSLIGFPPAIGGGSGNQSGASPTPGASFILLPGQGVAWQQPGTGNVNQLWNIQMIWAEK